VRDAITDFYDGDGCDHRGRPLRTILDFTDDELEGVHDYIQWLFPLDLPSPVNPLAPVVTPPIQTAFCMNDSLRRNLCRSCDRMFRFFGLSCAGPAMASSKITLKQPFYGKWMSPGNHNHARLTRMLKSLRLLGLGGCSASLFVCLQDLVLKEPTRISRVTLEFWRRTQQELVSPNNAEPFPNSDR
jgi:hypothetical protein